MIRFDIVVANYKRLPLFYENLGKLKHFDPASDRIVVLDCSPADLDQLAKLKDFAARSGLGKSIRFVARKNWLMNHGAQLDYVHLLNTGVLEKPQLSFFMQEHYLDTEREVKRDTIPAGQTIDLDALAHIHAQGRLVAFCARDGYRVTQFADKAALNEVYRHYYFVNKHPGEPSPVQVPGRRDFSLCIDGGNFCADPSVLMDYLRNPSSNWNAGPGTHGQTHVWETLLSYIHQQAGCGFHELSRGMTVWNPSELTQAMEDAGMWRPFYAFPVPWALYRTALCGYSVNDLSTQVPMYLLQELKLAEKSAGWAPPGDVARLG